MNEEEIAKALNDLKELSMTNYYGDMYFAEQAGTKLALKYIDKLQKENEESKELYNKLLIGYNKLVQEYLELEKVIDLMATELSRRPLMIYLGDERDDRLVILDNPKDIIKYYTKKAEE